MSIERTFRDALTQRSYAYASDRTVVPVAEDLISGRLAAAQLAEDAPTDR